MLDRQAIFALSSTVHLYGVRDLARLQYALLPWLKTLYLRVSRVRVCFHVSVNIQLQNSSGDSVKLLASLIVKILAYIKG
jgi:hypothetical protein